MFPKVDFGPVKVSCVDHLELKEMILNRYSLVQEESVSIITLNWEFVSKSYYFTKYRNKLLEADIITADGFPVYIFLKKIFSLNKRVTGADLVEWIFKKEEIKNIVIIGSQHQNEILEKYEGRVAFFYDGLVDKELWQNQKLRSALNKPQNKIILLALDSAKQLNLSREIKAQFKGKTIIGIGGSLDFISEKTKRCPASFSRFGLEWFYRLCQDPLRLYKRYFFVYPYGFFSYFKQHLKKIIS